MRRAMQMSRAASSAGCAATGGARRRALRVAQPAAQRSGDEPERGVEQRSPRGRLSSLGDVFGRGGANPLEEMMREMDALDRQLGSAYAFSPACDITESSSGYTLTAELPGLRREDVAIELEEEGPRGNTLLLRGSKESTHSEPEESSVDSDEGVRRVERTYGSFSRRWRLPPEVDTSNISASMRNGVLTVNVPKAQRKQQGKVIDITTFDE